ncbi:hypothetical protein PanWU01x14_321900 [Parasponia andersonii]|uniref:DUF3741 domain-containing protein n=1 Tax=Parasponia andersonii TaxID=3476 RepID=A0A2P5AKZ5_PARAD|nr:hypothetical protein PanWU01x14_321900 [Parasponia andersonii]
MKDLSLFFVKNSLGAKMRKGFRTICNGDDSTSTLDQQNSYGHLPNPNHNHDHHNMNISVSASNDVGSTLEEMILKLELEEERARSNKANNNNNSSSSSINIGRRMSCVNNNSSDILMSARKAALNQYPRFSLDGKDAMYRSSFRTDTDTTSTSVLVQGRRSVCCGDLSRLRGRSFYTEALPPTLAGESVVWCKPGVVAKLMGLEAVPVPVRRRPPRNYKRRQQHDHEVVDHDHDRLEMMMLKNIRSSGMSAGGSECKTSGSAGGYCVMNPMEVQSGDHHDHHDHVRGRAGGGWPTRRFL